MKKTEQPTIFVDMDGVLVDWYGPATVEVNKFMANPEGYPLPWMTEKQRQDLRGLAWKVSQELGRNYILQGEIENRYRPGKPEDDRDAQGSYLPVMTYTLLHNHLGWWVNLPWTHYGRALWSTCKDFAVAHLVELCILSAPMSKLGGGLGSIAGKHAWVLNHLGGHTCMILERNKQSYALAKGGRPNILIDDTPQKVESFREAGGHAAHIDKDLWSRS